MNLSHPFANLFRPKPAGRELYLSLSFLHSYVAACLWTIGEDGTLTVTGTAIHTSEPNSWKSRTEASDRVISDLSGASGEDLLHKVVFGLPGDMLNSEGDIDVLMKPHLKKMSTALSLTPMGFVNIDTAVVFQMKRDEGIPPSAILMHISGDTIILSLYRVGVAVGTRTVPIKEFVVEDIETAIKSFSEVEVLPSRMILYGEDKDVSERIQSQLLSHQWPNRANFLHYPKIDSLPLGDIARAVALAGASELAKSMGLESIQIEPVSVSHEKEKENPVSSEEKEDFVAAIDDAFSKEDVDAKPEDENVVAVAPEVLGFTKRAQAPEFEKERKKSKVAWGAVLSGIFSHIRLHIPHMRIPRIGGIATAVPFIFTIFVFLLAIAAVYFYLPQSTVILSVVPKTVSKEKTIVISPATTTIDSEKFVIPGKKQEKNVTGEKTMSVTGKKKIGDPSKGTVTLYNKTTTARTLKKGTIITAKSLQFTLDADTNIASASESIGSITFGKINAAVTAVDIGEEGNIAGSSEFSVKGFEISVLAGRNDQPFSGGKSREVTVVSRADYDALVKAVTDELVAKAKIELTASVSGAEKLIDATVKTAVTGKTFTEELDQEARDLHGKVTITISGISYNENDGKELIFPLASSDIPGGYAVSEGRTVFTITNPALKKDGSIVALGVIKIVAIPKIDESVIQKDLAGKTIVRAEEILKQIQGVASAEVSFKPRFMNKRLPMRPNNISLTVVVSE